MNSFDALHPLVSAFYFLSVLMLVMFSANPIFIFSAFLGGFFFYTKLRGKINIGEIGFCAVMFLAVSLTNPLFSHKGETVLFYLNNNPITLESVFYGINSGFMLLSTIYWFKCVNIILTSDKLLYLFAGFSPKTALVISSALGFIPSLKAQSERIRATQKTLGMYASDTWTDKLKSTLAVYSALIGYGLEGAIDTGNSMKSRGYGLSPRTNYSIYRFRKRDAFFLCLIILADIFFVAVFALRWVEFEFYPQIFYGKFDLKNNFTYILFGVFSFVPLIFEFKEGLKWKFYISRI